MNGQRRNALERVEAERIIFYPFGISKKDKRRFSEGVIPSKLNHVLEWLLEHEYIEVIDDLAPHGVFVYLTDSGKEALGVSEA